MTLELGRITNAEREESALLMLCNLFGAIMINERCGKTRFWCTYIMTSLKGDEVIDQIHI
jgi:hypothetical protein